MRQRGLHAWLLPEHAVWDQGLGGRHWCMPTPVASSNRAARGVDFSGDGALSLGAASPGSGADRARGDLPLDAIPDAIVLDIEIMLGLKV